MTPRQITEHLKQHLPDAIEQAFPDDPHPRVHTTPAHWRELAHHLRREPSLQMDWLGCITALDYVADEQLCACYELRSSVFGHWIAVKVFVDRKDPQVPTVMDLWAAADWHEREAFDLVGIQFKGHRDLRRILLPDDWQGHPLRKDYVFPRRYHGIPGSYEMDWQQKPDYPS